MSEKKSKTFLFWLKIKKKLCVGVGGVGGVGFKFFFFFLSQLEFSHRNEEAMISLQIHHSGMIWTSSSSVSPVKLANNFCNRLRSLWFGKTLGRSVGEARWEWVNCALIYGSCSQWDRVPQGVLRGSMSSVLPHCSSLPFPTHPWTDYKRCRCEREGSVLWTCHLLARKTNSVLRPLHREADCHPLHFLSRG